MSNTEYFYVYAPISGSITALDTYCCCGTTHYTHGGTTDYTNPRDVGGQGTLTFKASVNVKSIRIDSLPSTICQGYSPPYGAPWTNGVRVKMYRSLNGVDFIGQVYFGHVNNPSNAGLQNTNVWWIGSVPTQCPCGTNHAGSACNVSGCSSDHCFTGPHTHMERQNDSVSIANPQLYCNQPITAGSSWIYRWAILI